MPSRASVLLILGFAALPGCNRDGGEDPVIAAPAAGIPSGAVGAVGVSFDLPATSPEHDEPPPLPHPKLKHAPPPLALDPFADPPTTSGHDGEPPPVPPMHRHRGTAL